MLLSLETWDWIDRGGAWADLKDHRRQTLAQARARLMWHLPFWILLACFLAWRIPAARGLMALKEGSNYADGMSGPLLVPHLILNYVFYILHLFLLYPIFPVNFSLLGWHCWWLAAVALGVLGLLGILLLRGCEAGRQPLVDWVWYGSPEHSCLSASLRRVNGWFTFPRRVSPWPWARWPWALHIILHTGPKPWSGPGVAAVALLGLYTLVSLSYVETLGYVTSLVHQAESGLESRLATAPPGTEVYLVNLWQPAWMFERLVEIDFPRRSNFNVQVLSFDPIIVPEGCCVHSQLHGQVLHFLLPRPEQRQQDHRELARSGDSDDFRGGPGVSPRHC